MQRRTQGIAPQSIYRVAQKSSKLAIVSCCDQISCSHAKRWFPDAYSMSYDGVTWDACDMDASA